MTISVIIVNYNTSEVLEKCLKSILQYEKELSFEIIVVDNNSSDNSAQVIEKYSNEKVGFKSILLKDKVSFSAANNIGYDLSVGGYIIIMNPDIIFTEPLFDELTQAFESHTKTGAVCPVLNGTDGKFQYRYFQRFPTITQFVMFYSVIAKIFDGSEYFKNKYLCNYDINLNSGNPERTDQIPCAFLMTKRSIFEEAGKMNETYELFFEDVDLCYRIGKNHELNIDTSLQVTHLGGESFKTSDDYWLHGRFILSMIRFFENNYGPLRTLILKCTVYINSLFVILSENLKMIIGKKNIYRYKKHKHLITEFNKTYF